VELAQVDRAWLTRRGLVPIARFQLSDLQANMNGSAASAVLMQLQTNTQAQFHWVAPQLLHVYAIAGIGKTAQYLSARGALPTLTKTLFRTMFLNVRHALSLQ
jgi:hypothetical protein